MVSSKVILFRKLPSLPNSYWQTSKHSCTKEHSTWKHERLFYFLTKNSTASQKNRKSIGPFPYQWQMLVCKMSPTPLMRSYGRMSCKKGSFQQMHHNDELSKAVAQHNSRVIWQCPTWLTFGLSSAKRRGRHSPVILIHGPNLYQSRIYEREVSRGISQH